MPYINFYFYFVENDINIFYIGFILTATHLGNFVSKIIINLFSERFKIKFILFCIFFILSFLLNLFSEYFLQKEKNEITTFFILKLISRFIYGFSCGRLLTRKYIIQFLPESEIKFFSLVYIIIIYAGILFGILINFLLKDMKPLYISIISFYLEKYSSIFTLGAFASFIYLILIIILFTEPTEGSMLNQFRTASNNKIVEEEPNQDLLSEEKNIYDYKELYDENETGDDSKKINNLLFRESNMEAGRNTTNKELILITNNLEENNDEIKNKTFDEKVSNNLTDNLLDTKELLQNEENEKEEGKNDDPLSTPLNISSIKNKDSKDTTNIDSRTTNKLIKNITNNELISAEEMKGLNSLEKELIDMNAKNNFDDVNLLPNELERIRNSQFNSNRSYLCSFFVFITILLLTNSLNEFILISIPSCFISINNNNNKLVIYEFDVIIIIMILQILSFPFIIFFRMFITFNVERRLLLYFYVTLVGFTIIFLVCKIIFYQDLDINEDNMYDSKNILYRAGIILLFILSSLVEGTTNLLSNKIIPSFVKICHINNRYLISYSTVFGKILGGLIFCVLCLMDDKNTIFEDTNIFAFNIWIFSCLTIILFLFFIFSYKKLRVRAISKLFYIND